MQILVLKFGDEEVELPYGESFIGRALDCQLRFNDASVSRRHLRVICRREEAHIENLSMTNEALLNAMPIEEACRLKNGDKIQIAHQVLEVVLFERGEENLGNVQPLLQQNMVEPDSGGWAEETVQHVDLEDDFGFDVNDLDERNCPKCRTRVPVSQADCGSCGYLWPATGPARRTQKIVMPKEKLREDRRRIVRVPVIYSSDDLTLDVVARDLGRGGMYLASEILEPIGTECHITALPDGRPALYFKAAVCHVSTESVSGRPPGFGVKFHEYSADARQWLDAVTREEASDPES